MSCKSCKAILIALMLIFPVFVSLGTIQSNTSDQIEKNISNNSTPNQTSSKLKLRPIDENLVENPVKTIIGDVNSIIRTSGITWTDPPGTWWDTDWEYRVNVTVREPNIADRDDWPVNVFLEFSPAAYKYSIRVVDPSGNEIPSQIWNITYANTTHIESCSVTFLVDINQNGEKTYSIYWSVDETDPPTYPKSITFYEQEGVYYIYSPKGWHITLPGSYGGKVSAFHFNDSNLEHQSSTINDEITHFGPTVSPTLAYEDYWGEYNTNNNKYVFRGIREVNDPLEQIYAGVIFVTYVVEKVPIEDNTGVSIGNTTYYYQIFNWGINVYEEIDFGSTISNGLVYLGGWIFDQDNGDEGSRFNVVYPPENIMPSETWELILYDEFTSIDTNTWYTRASDDASSWGYPLSDGDNLVLTPNDDGEYGQAWLNWEIDSDFIAEFSFWIGGGTDAGADGLVFMFYKSRGYSPSTGGSLGFSGSGTYYGFGIEVDTYGNKDVDPYGTETSDTAGHIAIIQDTYSTHLASYAVPRSVLRGQWHTIRVKVIEDNVKVWFDDDLIINYTDPVFLDRTYKWMGFSAATGGLNDYHKIGYFKLWVRNPGCEGEDIYNEKDYSNGESIGIFNNDTRVGMGAVYHDLSFLGTAQATSKIVVYNEGNQTNDGMQDSEDYIYFAVNLSKFNASNGDTVSLSYTVFPWNATNSVATSETKFDTLVNMFKNPLETEVNRTERFKIRVKVRVIDAAGEVIPNANVTLTNNTLKYTGFTDKNGEIVFDVYRVKYQFIAKITNNINVTYENSSLEIAYNDTSQWHYCNLTDTVVIKFKDIYRVVLTAYAADNETILQNGLLRLNDSSNIYTGYTNLTGDLEFYIQSGTWSIMFNHTSTDEVWDYFNLTLVGYGQLASNTQKYNLQVDKDMTLRLIDVSATQPPEITWLELYETSSTYEKYWNEIVSIKVKFYRTLNKDLIDGNITWFVVDESDTLYIKGSVDTSNGVATFTVNTSYLLPDKNYIIIINSSEIYTSPPSEGFALPSPINVFLTVNARPTDMSVTINPSSTVYYLEDVYVTVVLKDYFTGDSISQTNTTVKISGIQGYIQLTEISTGTYQAYLPTLDAGIYTITITAEKGNYTTVREEYILRVMERPTSISAPISIEIPWNATYSFTVDYIDTRLNTHISSAHAVYKILNSRTGKIIVPETYLTEKSDHYIVKINIYGNNLQEENYLIQLIMGKKNYINQTITIPFTIRLRQTSLEKETSTIKVYYGETFSLKVYFYDLDNASSPIINAISNYTISDFETGDIVKQGDLTDMNNGTYYLEFDTSSLRVKNYYITITVYKEHYSSASVSINLIIEPIPTTAYTSKLSDSIEWGLYSVFYIMYNDSRTNTGINADKAVFEITNGSAWSSGEIPLVLIDNGVYKLNISTIDYHLSPGTYKITITLEKLYHENKTIVLTLTITEIGTYAYAQPANVTLYWGEEAEIKVFYNMTREKTFINATATYIVKDLDNGTTIEIERLIQTKDGYYLVQLDSSLLTDGHRYVITITFTKTYYVSATVTIYVKVLPIPVSTSVTPPITDLTWGDDFNFTLVLINTLDQTYLTDVSITLLVLVEGEMVNVGNAITYMTANNTFIITIKSGLLNTSAYTIRLIITKVHYDIPNVEMVARIHPVEITVTMRTEKTVYKNPITSTATTTVEITLVEAGTGTPVTGATLTILVMRGETEILRVTAVESEYYPGVYVAKIDWTNIEPGDYTLRVVINSIQRGGYETSKANIISAAGTVELGTSVDYLGGSTVIAGKPYPNLLVYPVIIAAFIAVGFVSYKYYAWIKLPVEVRELINLIKAIQKNIFEYEAPPREEVFKDILRRELVMD